MEKPTTRHIAYGDLSFGDELYDFSSTNLYLALKRVFDLLLLTCAAPVVLPIIALCALLVMCDGGPAFYTQLRLGKDGAIFKLWKLRTMVPDGEELLRQHIATNPAARQEWESKQKLTKDPRVTWIGRYLRKYSLDELPQIFNVLAGEMSIVGPRPMLPEQRQLYPGSAYFDLRPGLTGLWQISERNGCAFAERARYDSRYSTIVSLDVDVWIIWRTLFVVLGGTGL